MGRGCCPSFDESSCNGVDDTSQLINEFFLLLLQSASTSLSLNLRVVTTISISSFVLVLPIAIVSVIGLRLVNKISSFDKVFYFVLQNVALLN